MPKNFWKTVNKVIEQADIILEVVDARDVDGTRNKEIEDKVKKKGKVLISVLNKCDLADKRDLEKIKKRLKKCVFVSCKEYHGFKMLKEAIMIEANGLKIDKPRVGVLGYPNMGKSSVINALKGSKAARTSAESGYTKGKQFIAARSIKLIDTPGVIPYKEKGELKYALMGITTKVKDADLVVMQFMEEQEGVLEKYYNVDVEKDKEGTLEKITLKLNFLKKGGLPDIKRGAEAILKDLQRGKIKI